MDLRSVTVSHLSNLCPFVPAYFFKLKNCFNDTTEWFLVF